MQQTAVGKVISDKVSRSSPTAGRAWWTQVATIWIPVAAPSYRIVSYRNQSREYMNMERRFDEPHAENWSAAVLSVEEEEE